MSSTTPQRPGPSLTQLIGKWIGVAVLIWMVFGTIILAGFHFFVMREKPRPGLGIGAMSLARHVTYASLTGRTLPSAAPNERVCTKEEMAVLKVASDPAHAEAVVQACRFAIGDRRRDVASAAVSHLADECQFVAQKTKQVVAAMANYELPAGRFDAGLMYAHLYRSVKLPISLSERAVRAIRAASADASCTSEGTLMITLRKHR